MKRILLKCVQPNLEHRIWCLIFNISIWNKTTTIKILYIWYAAINTRKWEIYILMICYLVRQVNGVIPATTYSEIEKTLNEQCWYVTDLENRNKIPFGLKITTWVASLSRKSFSRGLCTLFCYIFLPSSEWQIYTTIFWPKRKEAIII